MGRRINYGSILVLAAIGVLTVAASAAASSGQITRAYANADWTRGSLAGQITWTECGSSCSWIPTATVQPTLPEYHCLGNEAIDSDPNTSAVWSGGGKTANGEASFDLINTPILNGVHGQRLCLSVIETRLVPDAVCEAQKKVIEEITGKPVNCPPVSKTFYHVLATALLTLEPPPALPTTTVPVTPSGKAVKGPKRCGKGKRKVRRGGKVRCVRKRPPKGHKRVPSL